MNNCRTIRIADDLRLRVFVEYNPGAYLADAVRKSSTQARRARRTLATKRQR